jgi:hypothetical protein
VGKWEELERWIFIARIGFLKILLIPQKVFKKYIIVY